jgi:hypothetical protein
LGAGGSFAARHSASSPIQEINMPLSVILSTEQFALYQSFMGAEPEDIALALTDVHYRLDESAARFVAYSAWSERRAWDQWQEVELAESAVDAEFDLTASTFPSGPRPIEPDREATMREAYRVACRARTALPISGADLILLTVGAFILDMDIACDIACAAHAGRTLESVTS